MSNIMQSLWIGPKLSNMEKLSMQSFIDNGHKYHLYTYGEVDGIPDGVIIKDGNEILDKSEIYRYKSGSVSAFSNLFRFTLLYKKGGYWVDTDMICVKPFKLDNEYIIPTEPDAEYSYNIITSSFLKMPKGSKVALKGIEIQKHFKKKILSGEIVWSAGPQCVKLLVEMFKLEKFLLNWDAICSCNYLDINTLLQTKIKKSSKIISNVNEIPKNMLCIHLWHECWSREKIDKNGTFEPNSLYEHFKRKHKIN